MTHFSDNIHKQFSNIKIKNKIGVISNRTNPTYLL
jgi:hypothetical protein